LYRRCVREEGVDDAMRQQVRVVRVLKETIVGEHRRKVGGGVQPQQMTDGTSGVTLRRTYVIGEKGEEDKKSDIEAWREEKDRARGRTPGHTIVESLLYCKKILFFESWIKSWYI
jgi:hypothetical protein